MACSCVLCGESPCCNCMLTCTFAELPLEDLLRSYEISGAGLGSAAGRYEARTLPTYNGVTAYAHIDAAVGGFAGPHNYVLFRWQKLHWVLSDLGPEMDNFDESNFAFTAPIPPGDTCDLPCTTGWSRANGARTSAAIPVITCSTTLHEPSYNAVSRCVATRGSVSRNRPPGAENLMSISSPRGEVSFEELRMLHQRSGVAPSEKPPGCTGAVRSLGTGVYEVVWTPTAAGKWVVSCTVDGEPAGSPPRSIEVEPSDLKPAEAAAAGGAFGLAGAKPAAGGSIFGVPAKTSSSLKPGGLGLAGGGMFGKAAATGGMFGKAAATGGMFGKAAATGGMFGKAAETGGAFGGAASGGAFGKAAATGSVFGAAAPSPLFGPKGGVAVATKPAASPAVAPKGGGRAVRNFKRTGKGAAKSAVPDRTAFNIAVQTPCSEIVSVLLAQGINRQDEFGWTVLHHLLALRTNSHGEDTTQLVRALLSDERITSTLDRSVRSSAKVRLGSQGSSGRGIAMTLDKAGFGLAIHSAFLSESILASAGSASSSLRHQEHTFQEGTTVADVAQAVAAACPSVYADGSSSLLWHSVSVFNKWCTLSNSDSNCVTLTPPGIVIAGDRAPSDPRWPAGYARFRTRTRGRAQPCGCWRWRCR